MLLSTVATLAFAGIASGAQAQEMHFNRVSTLPVYLNLAEGVDPVTETVAEIISASEDEMLLAYTDSPGERIGFLDLSDPAAPAPAGETALAGEPTSVKIVGDYAFAAVNTSENYVEPSGHVAVIDLADKSIVATCDVGGQPDSIAGSPDGTFVGVVIENERDEDLNDGVIPQLPAGGFAIFDLGGDGLPTNCDAARMVEMTGLAEVAGEDPEPEFVDINSDNVAVITLQENNHLALVDMASGEVTAHFSAGTVDLDAIDTVEDDVIAGSGNLTAVPREPDAVTWIDNERFATANEGDYKGGSRGFTIFDTAGNVLYDSGNTLEHFGMSAGHYPEGRAENKGVEPEGIEYGRFGDTGYIFVNMERANFVAVYEDTGAEPELVGVLPTAIGPEGSLALPDRNLFVVATEVDAAEDNIRATVSVYELAEGSASYPYLLSGVDETTGAPIGWGALSGLVADPADAARLYAVNDSFYGESRIYTIDLDQAPAAITDYVTLTKDGAPIAYDLEGIALREDGGFWLASEGHPDNGLHNYLIAVAADGTVEQELTLPTDVEAVAVRFGFEGVASWMEDGTEHVIVAVQREWGDDPDGTVKLALYSPSDESWSFVRYPIDKPTSPNGGWVGLSEITYLGDRRFALIERDNQPGLFSTHKVISVIDLAGVTPQPFGSDLPIVDKTVAIDLLPAMLADQGWISDKPEGLAVTADGTVIVVTDNDGVDDATGQTQLLRIGSSADLQ